MIPTPYKILAALVAVAASLAGAFWAGHEWRDKECDLSSAGAKVENVTQARETEAERERRSQVIARDVVAELEADEPEVRTITKEVIRYVETPSDDRCELPPDWVQLHDRAARLTADGGAPGGGDGTPGGVTDAHALEVVTDNYKACNTWRTRLVGCQRFVSEVCQGE